MRVAAVIPTYNHADTVLEAVRSVVGQFPVSGLILVDDASEDDTFKVLDGEFDWSPHQTHPGGTLFVAGDGGADVPVLYLRLASRSGPANARNLGMAVLRPYADAYALLDSDDFYLPGKIEKSVQVLQAYPEVGFVYSDYCTVDPAGRLHPQFKRPYSVNALLRECIVNCDSVVRASLFDEVKFPSIRTCEDYGFWLKASRRCMGWHLAEELVCIRVGPRSSTNTVPPEEWRANYRKAFEYAGFA